MEKFSLEDLVSAWPSEQPFTRNIERELVLIWVKNLLSFKKPCFIKATSMKLRNAVKFNKNSIFDNLNAAFRLANDNIDVNSHHSEDVN